jgi:hypothetical protein
MTRRRAGRVAFIFVCRSSGLDKTRQTMSQLFANFATGSRRPCSTLLEMNLSHTRRALEIERAEFPSQNFVAT